MTSAREEDCRSSLDELADGAAIYVDAFADGLRPDAQVTVSEWADRHRMLSSVEAAEPGPWRTSRTPYLREIMDELSPSSSATDICFKKASQIGGTECGNNWTGAVIDLTPGPMMYVLPTSDMAKRASKTRIAAMIEETPVLRTKVAEARSRDAANSARMKEFAGGVLIIAGANSAVELRGQPIRFLYCDEIDAYPSDLDGEGDPLKLAEKRTGTFARKKRFKTSTPTIRGFSRIDVEFDKSDQRYYFVACPHCAHEQRLVWEQLRWEQGRQVEYSCTGCGVISDGAGVTHGPHGCPDCGTVGQASQETLREKVTSEVTDVWYECAACSGRIDEYAKPALLAAGRWIAQAPGPGRSVGFHLNALYSPLGWYSWKDAVTEYLESVGRPTLRKVFVNTVLGESYEDDVEQPSDTQLAQRAELTYRIRTVPMGGLMLTVGGDVQGDRLEVKVKAWGRGEESWLVDYQVLYGDPTQLDGPGAVWAQLDAVLEQRWPHAGGGTLRIAAAAIDTGGHATQTVYEYCRRRAHRHVIAIKGASRAGKAIIGKPTLQDVTHQGKTIPEGVKLWPIGTDTAKALIYARLAVETPGPGCMHFPVGLADEYYRQLVAEKLITHTNRAGYQVRHWAKDPNRRNEALDCEVYAYAAALYAGVTRVNWDKLEQLVVPSPVGDLFAPAAAPAESAPAPVSAETTAAAPAPHVAAALRRPRVLSASLRPRT